jgi:hypothetical protein
MFLGPLETELEATYEATLMANIACAGQEYAAVCFQGKALIHALVITFRPKARIAWKTKAFTRVGFLWVNVISRSRAAPLGGSTEDCAWTRR